MDEGARSGVTALLEVVLADQHQMSAVELFSELHEVGLAGQVGWYRDLMPASPPGPGQQYGFEVDLDACTGCKACVTACHRSNGLDDGESWRSAGPLATGGLARSDTGGSTRGAAGVASSAKAGATCGAGHASGATQVVTTACHHCVEPACLAGCPVNAYEKDPVTGIVAHLDDQCIGCGYCLITCPYQVPAYNHRLGIVRKCDMCRGRLAAGEAPACVQACPNSAIQVKVVDVGVLHEAARSGRFLAGAPEPSRTVPATTFRTRRGLDLAPSTPGESWASSRPEPGRPELALVWLLVLSQVAAGMAVAGAILGSLAPLGLPSSPGLGPAGSWQAAEAGSAVLAMSLGFAATLASLAHLGRPALAWRALLGVRHSWLSREVVALGAFVGLAAAWTAATLATWAVAGATLPAGAGWVWLERALGVASAGAGLAAVACSVMVYVFTGRPWWRAGLTGPRFASTVAIGGACGSFAVLGSVNAGGLAGLVGRGSAAALALAMTAGVGAVLGGESLARFRLCRVRAAVAGPACSTGRQVAAVPTLPAARRMAPRRVAPRRMAPTRVAPRRVAQTRVDARRAGAPAGEMAGCASLLRRRQLRRQRAWRVGLSLGGALTLAGGVGLAGPGPGMALAWVGLAAVVAGELVGRTTFFVAVAPTLMPGGRR